MKDCDDRLSHLTPEQRSLLTLRLARQRVEQTRNNVVGRRKNPGKYPLSYAQERLWFLNQIEPHNPFYIIPAALRLRGPLNAAALERSLSTIVERHEILRANFETVEGDPHQFISPPAEFSFHTIDLTRLPEQEREEELKRLAEAEILRPFDLAHDPLLRARLLRLGNEDNVLLVSVHHIVFDGWSTGVFFRELSALYDSYVHERRADLGSLPIQYADYAAWQREWLAGGILEKQLAYWRGELSDDPAPLDLPLDHPRPAVQTSRGSCYSTSLSGDLSRMIGNLAREEGLTPFMSLLAAFQLLLHRYTSRPEIRVGTPVANRTRAEIEGLIGFFVNTLVMKTEFAGDPTVREYLQRVRHVVVEAMNHQDIPFEKLVEELNPTRDMSYSPLFQVMFDLQPSPLRALHLGDIQVNLLDVKAQTAKFDVSLIVTEEETGFAAQWEYNTDLFELSTIERMAGHFETLVRGFVEHPEGRLSSLSLMGALERERVLVEWNNTLRDYPRESSVHELFEHQVVRTPDAIALEADGRQFTYTELDVCANQVARLLRSLGVGPDVLVGINVERCPEMVIGLLGILKAGGAYVPLDPSYPRDRIRYMLEDAGVPIVLTQRKLSASLLDLRPHLVYLDADWQNTADSPALAAPVHARENDLAYVIYTSGSTGMPKGVAIEHRSAVAFIHWAQEVYSRDELSRVLASTSICFDLSVFELFVTLSVGGIVILAENALHLPTLRGRENVSLINTVPSAMTELLRLHAIPSSTRTINLAGEPLTIALVREIYSLTSVRKVYDLYGPSEDTTYSTFALRSSTGRATIGRPIANSQVYILDTRGDPVPPGVVGELHIGGEGLARGYLHRPESTAERFLPNPFGVREGARMYRTGDLARYFPDGSIEFLGRLDHQVKIRGFRIELGEIESALRLHPRIKEALVMAREAPSGERRIVAYCVPDQDCTLEQSEVRGFLKRTLPDYMVPSILMSLRELPRTPNGKLDRRALPNPDLERPEGGEEYIAPRTPIEDLLAGIWTEVLGVSNISVHDNFFLLGGHSLLATRVVARVQNAFQREIPVRLVFEFPTISEFACEIERRTRGEKEQEYLPLSPRSGNDNLPLSFAQLRLWFLDRLEPGSRQYVLAGALRIRGPLNPSVLERSLNEIVRRHEVLRTTFPLQDGIPIQRILPSLKIPLDIIDLRTRPDSLRQEEGYAQIVAVTRQPFELALGPLMRASLICLDQNDYIAVFAMHHIVSDGWSIGVLNREIAKIYNAFVEGQSSPLQNLPLQYADFSLWQRTWLQGEIMEKELGYWKAKLTGSSPFLELPFDHPRPSIQSSRGANYEFTVSADLARVLRRVSQQEGVTLFMTLLGAFQVLLCKYSGDDDIAVGTPIANRGRRELEELVGIFVNTLVLRTDLSGDPTVREVLQRVRTVALEAYAHQDAPFEKIVDALEVRRDMSHSPLFQVMFVLQNMPAEPIQLSGMTLEPLRVDLGVAGFDLTLTMTEGPDDLAGTLEYNTDLFEMETIHRMGEQYVRVLEGVAKDVERRISSLPLLSELERRQVISEWNETRSASLPEPLMHELFERQANDHPEAEALADGSTVVGYGELNRRANQLARYLQRQGIEAEKLVGLSLERSVAMAVGLLGILKAGGAYVPLDVGLPEDRLNWICTDAQLGVVVTQRSLANRFLEKGLRVVCLDGDAEDILKESSENLERTVSGDNLAYMIYTSGSTGKPKGVMVRHSSVVNHNVAMARAFGLGPGERVLQFSSISFDAAVEELFPAWGKGAAVVLRDEESLGGGEAFGSLVEREGITLVDLPTAFWGEWVESLRMGGKGLGGRLRLVVVGGDKVPTERYVAWRKFAEPDVKWINTYGPTETTIVSTAYAPDCEGWEGRREVPIGRGIANTEVYLLDGRMEPVGIGMVGEIYIGGHGVARGYWGRPELTAERFVPDPFGNTYGGRLYRTGDRGRWRSDGEIEFVGRVDRQVKVRGYRIELEEVEGLLATHPLVREVAVEVRAAGGREKRLVAYCVARGGETLSIRGLREYAQRMMPEYMVPGVFVLMADLPKTPGGKIDRRALPAPELQSDGAGEVREGPRTQVEETLVAIWQEVLGVKEVGVRDNFFELGGDSILSIQVIAKAHQAGVHLTVQQMFQHPTIEGLACVAGAETRVEAEQGLVSGPVPLTPIQHWFFSQELVERAHWNQALLLGVSEELDIGMLREVVGTLLRHHDALRMRFRMNRESWEQSIAGEDETPPVERIDLRNKGGEEFRVKAIEEYAEKVQRSLDITRGPLLRVAYMDLGGGSGGRLLIAIHHLVGDGVSWRILLEDFQTAYEQLRRGDTIQLPPKTTSFQSWSRQLQQYAQSKEAVQELRYWLNLSRRKWKVHHLPLDFKGGANTYASMRKSVTRLGAAETHTLIQDIPHGYGVQINDVLLTILTKAFARWTGKNSLLVDLEGHGREPIVEGIDLSRTVGWFTSLFPVLVDIGGMPGWSTMLTRVSEQLSMVPNHGVGYGILRYLNNDVEVRERLGQTPRAEVSFNYMGQFGNLLAGTKEFSLARESPGSEYGGGYRQNLIDVTLRVVGGELEFTMLYSSNLHRDETIAAIAKQFVIEIGSVLRDFQSTERRAEQLNEPAGLHLSRKDLEGIMAETVGSSEKGKDDEPTRH